MIYLVRHGRKVKSTGNQFYNETLSIMDDPLSDEGKKDAERLAEYFKNIDIKKIFVSQYVRTYQTAEPTALQKGLAIIVDGRVNEINTGELRNMTDEEAAAAYPQLWSDIMGRQRDFRFPGGDSGEDVKRRQDSFLDDIMHEKDDVMVVTHDGFIRLLMCNLLGLPVYKRYKLKTQMGAVSVIEHDDDGWKIVRFNQSV